MCMCGRCVDCMYVYVYMYVFVSCVYHMYLSMHLYILSYFTYSFVLVYTKSFECDLSLAPGFRRNICTIHRISRSTISGFSSL